MLPIICMVTAPQPSTPESDRALVDRIGAAARAACTCVQIRQRDWDEGALAQTGHGGSPRRQGNPRACACERSARRSAGCGSPRRASARRFHSRASAASPLLASSSGVPLHSPEEARGGARGGGLDYLIFGTVFSTSSKPEAPICRCRTTGCRCARLALPVLAMADGPEQLRPRCRVRRRGIRRHRSCFGLCIGHVPSLHYSQRPDAFEGRSFLWKLAPAHLSWTSSEKAASIATYG